MATLGQRQQQQQPAVVQYAEEEAALPPLDARSPGTQQEIRTFFSWPGPAPGPGSSPGWAEADRQWGGHRATFTPKTGPLPPPPPTSYPLLGPNRVRDALDPPFIKTPICTKPSVSGSPEVLRLRQRGDSGGTRASARQQHVQELVSRQETPASLPLSPRLVLLPMLQKKTKQHLGMALSAALGKEGGQKGRSVGGKAGRVSRKRSTSQAQAKGDWELLLEVNQRHLSAHLEQATELTKLPPAAAPARAHHSHPGWPHPDLSAAGLPPHPLSNSLYSFGLRSPLSSPPLFSSLAQEGALDGGLGLGLGQDLFDETLREIERSRQVGRQQVVIFPDSYQQQQQQQQQSLHPSTSSKSSQLVPPLPLPLHDPRSAGVHTASSSAYSTPSLSSPSLQRSTSRALDPRSQLPSSSFQYRQQQQQQQQQSSSLPASSVPHTGSDPAPPLGQYSQDGQEGQEGQGSEAGSRRVPKAGSEWGDEDEDWRDKAYGEQDLTWAPSEDLDQDQDLDTDTDLHREGAGDRAGERGLGVESSEGPAAPSSRHVSRTPSLDAITVSSGASLSISASPSPSPSHPPSPSLGHRLPAADVGSRGGSVRHSRVLLLHSDDEPVLSQDEGSSLFGGSSAYLHPGVSTDGEPAVRESDAQEWKAYLEQQQLQRLQQERGGRQAAGGAAQRPPMPLRSSSFAPSRMAPSHAHASPGASSSPSPGPSPVPSPSRGRALQHSMSSIAAINPAPAPAPAARPVPSPTSRSLDHSLSNLSFSRIPMFEFEDLPAMEGEEGAEAEQGFVEAAAVGWADGGDAGGREGGRAEGLVGVSSLGGSWAVQGIQEEDEEDGEGAAPGGAGFRFSGTGQKGSAGSVPLPSVDDAEGLAAAQLLNQEPCTAEAGAEAGAEGPWGSSPPALAGIPPESPPHSESPQPLESPQNPVKSSGVGYTVVTSAQVYELDAGEEEALRLQLALDQVQQQLAALSGDSDATPGAPRPDTSSRSKQREGSRAAKALEGRVGSSRLGMRAGEGASASGGAAMGRLVPAGRVSESKGSAAALLPWGGALQGGSRPGTPPTAPGSKPGTPEGSRRPRAKTLPRSTPQSESGEQRVTTTLEARTAAGPADVQDIWTT